MTDIQFKWRGALYECTEQWNKDFQTKYDYRVFKADEFRWLISERQYDVVAQRLHGVGEEKIDKKYYKRIQE
tara:strand:+ start:286 stop:501 length:216 start_codon:yes stop_codon:yes gene_type:complete